MLIEPGSFKKMGIPLLAGREFRPQDTPAALKVAIVSERVAAAPRDRAHPRVRRLR